MTQFDRDNILAWANKLNDVALEQAYYRCVFECLGSQTEEMYERGYDIRDIKERERYEEYRNKKCNILEALCKERGIKLWE
jgi:hypothetical protein